MKLIRFGQPGDEQCGVILPDGRRLDVSPSFSRYDEEFFASDGINRLRNWLATNESTAPSVPVDARLGSPIGRPSKIICIGLNYVDHAKESGMPIPRSRSCFSKPPAPSAARMTTS